MAACVVGCGPRERAPDTATDAPTLGATSCRRVAPTEWVAAPVGAATFVVNRATRGMTSSVRWAIAPDSSAILVIDDPVAVESDAIPDGLLLASERTGRVFRMDSVWSAAPAPDWRRLAVGRAVVLAGGESQQIPAERWNEPAARLRALLGPVRAPVAESLRAHSFPVSGMAAVQASAVTLVAEVDGDVANAPLRFVALDGWRVRWSCDGADVLVGTPPLTAQDDASSGGERRVSSSGGAITAAPPADDVSWQEGPTLDISTPMARGAARSLVVRGAVIAEERGRIAVRRTRPGGRDSVVDVGPGVPLAATRGGHFILAVTARAAPRPHESPEHAVVYRVP